MHYASIGTNLLFFEKGEPTREIWFYEHRVPEGQKSYSLTTLARPYISYGSSDRVDIVLTNPPFGGNEEEGIESHFPKKFQTRETANLFLALVIRLLKPSGRAAVVLPDGSLFGEGVKTRLKEALMEECNLHTIVRLPNRVFKPSDRTVFMFCKGERVKRWVCAVAKETETDGFLVTAYPTDAIKEGVRIWPK